MCKNFWITHIVWFGVFCQMPLYLFWVPKTQSNLAKGILWAKVLILFEILENYLLHKRAMRSFYYEREKARSNFFIKQKTQKYDYNLVAYPLSVYRSAISLELIIQCALSKTKVTTVVISSSFPPFTNKYRSCQVDSLIQNLNTKYLPPMFHCIPFCTFSGMECQPATSNSRHQSWP